MNAFALSVFVFPYLPAGSGRSWRAWRTGQSLEKHVSMFSREFSRNGLVSQLRHHCRAFREHQMGPGVRDGQEHLVDRVDLKSNQRFSLNDFFPCITHQSPFDIDPALRAVQGVRVGQTVPASRMRHVALDHPASRPRPARPGN